MADFVILLRGQTVSSDVYLNIHLSECFAATGTEIFQQNGAPHHTEKNCKRLSGIESTYITSRKLKQGHILQPNSIYHNNLADSVPKGEKKKMCGYLIKK